MMTARPTRIWRPVPGRAIVAASLRSMPPLDTKPRPSPDSPPPGSRGLFMRRSPAESRPPAVGLAVGEVLGPCDRRPRPRRQVAGLAKLGQDDAGAAGAIAVA